jgi:hypothetical protein
MMLAGLVQLLAPVLPPMARARTRYVTPGVRLVRVAQIYFFRASCPLLEKLK